MNTDYIKLAHNICIIHKEFKIIPLTLNYISEYVSILKEPEFYEYMDSKEIASMDFNLAIELLSKRCINPKSNRIDTEIRLMIYDETNKRIAGSLVIQKPIQTSIEIGWYIHKDYTGKGLGTQIILKLIDYIFDNMPSINSIIAEVQSINNKSIHIVKKLGFKEKSRYEGPCTTNIVYALKRGDRMQQVIFQLDSETLLMSSDCINIYDSYSYINWLSMNNTYEILYTTSDKIEFGYRTIQDLVLDRNRVVLKSNIIAVGSIEFTERFLGKRIEPIGIPDKLLEQRFTGRSVIKSDINSDELSRFISKLDKFFIKSLDRSKSDYTGIYDRIHLESIKDKLGQRVLVSDKVDIISEWRCFVLKGKIIDIRQYLGELGKQYDLNKIRQMVLTWTDSPPAYTLDIALTSEGNTIIIEAHNFLSCGLYGFESTKDLGRMTTMAYNFEKNT